MKSKRLLFTLVFVLAFVLAFAISACAATITLYSGADNTSSSTTHNGSLTLTGNTEENETVTVYFSDDGRAWKAGETVSFTEDTNLYTIECTKIANYTEWKNATAGNYILVADFDLNYETVNPNGGEGTGTRHNAGAPMKPATGTTTRVFFNNHTIATGNQILFEGTDLSIYLFGNGKLDGYWGGKFMNLKFSASADCEVVIGKGIVANSDWTNCNPFFNINDYKADSKLDIHFYGSYTSGQLIGQNSTPSTGSYNLYLHDGCTLNLSNYRDGGRLIATATTPIANIVIDGGTFTFGRENVFVDSADLSRLTANITGGTFTFSYATTKAQFESYIDAEYQAKAISDLSFGIICKECSFEKTLGDDFVDLTTDFTINNYCPKCKTTGESTAVSKVFTAKGYSINSSGTAINGGFEVNPTSLALYEEVVGKVTYGIAIANADTFDGKTFFDAENKVNTDKSIQVEIDSKYNHFSCSINFGTTSNSTLNLVITAYVISEDGVSFIQHSTGDVVDSSKIAGGTFKSITLDMLVSAQPVATKEEL